MSQLINNIKIILSVLLIIFILFSINQCKEVQKLKQDIEYQKNVAKQNYAALNDSIEIYKSKSGLNTYGKPIAEMSPDELQKYLPELYARLKDELGEVKIIWKTKIEYRDTGSVKNAIIQLDSNKYALTYDYYSKDSLLYIKSNNTFFVNIDLIDIKQNKYFVNVKSGISTLEDISLKLDLTTGIKKEGELYKIFVTPQNKNVIISDLQGADVSGLIMQQGTINKQKRWSIGPNVGVGVAIGNKSYCVGVIVGVSLQYSLINF